jgi:hypothetical protein
LGAKNKTRREFLGKLDLQMNLMVKGGFGDGACGNVKHKRAGSIGNELEDKENYRVDEWG